MTNNKIYKTIYIYAESINGIEIFTSQDNK